MIPQRLHADAALIAESLVSQPALFDIPTEASPAAHAVVAQRGRYTGERSTLDESKTLLVCALRALGCSDRKIAEAAGVARESIPLHLAAGEASGRIRPLKDRLTQWVGLLAEESTLAARDLVADVRAGKCGEEVTNALRALGPIVGIATEKLQLLTGQATEIIEQRSAPSHDEFAAWMKSAVAIEAAPSQSESVGLLPSSVDLQALPAIGAGAGAELVPDSGAKVAADLAQGAGREQGEGGVASCAGVSTVDGSTPSKIISQGRRPKAAKRHTKP